MLLQSHRGEIHLLPAVPAAWTRGAFAGLRARGGFEVDATWADGKLTAATVRSRLGRSCRVRSSGPLAVTTGGQPVAAERPGPNIVCFPTESGGEYALLPGEE
jgi:alpha-L-fucosidase 2